MTLSRITILLGVTMLLGHSAEVHAQVRLEATETFPEPFSRVVGVRELSDGRLIVADRLELHVSYLDFATGSITQISREGEGPGEYGQPLGLFAYPDDATLLTDIGNMRIAHIDKNGMIEETWPMMQQGDDGAMSFLRPTATDERGMVYYSGLGISIRTQGGGSFTRPDSSYIMRLDLKNGPADTVAALFREPTTTGTGSVTTGGGGTFSMTRGMLRPFSAADGWAVAPDGRVAVARSLGYRVDWYDSDGTVSVGSSVSYEPVRVRRAEKEQWADGQASNSVVMMIGGGGGGGSRSAQLPRPDLDEVEFPEVMPPFGRSAVSVSPRGNVWVRLNRRANSDGPLFDIFDANGQKTMQVALPANRQLVGFGADVIYAVAVDEDDLQWLEKYPYP